MEYQKVFDPNRIDGAQAASFSPKRQGDHPKLASYVYTDEIILAVNVAMATGRPLLVRGASGSGKSSLARSVADSLKWRYYEIVVTSRTQAQDLLWSFDSLRRLNDAQAGLLKSPAQGSVKVEQLAAVETAQRARYVVPGVLWWAFDRLGAARRGLSADMAGDLPPTADPSKQPDSPHAVVLIDEIDKADPDVPNNLLVPLGAFRFTVQETGVEVEARTSPLVFITTNEERELPRAFVRRCVAVTLSEPDEERLVKIAEAHFGDIKRELHRPIAKQVLGFSKGEPGKPKVSVSAAEYLDVLAACRDLDVKPNDNDPTWNAVLGATLSKSAAGR
jgi:MoxR-like ATPase